MDGSSIAIALFAVFVTALSANTGHTSAYKNDSVWEDSMTTADSGSCGLIQPRELGVID